MHNIFKNTEYRMLELFMEEPHRDLGLREMARLLKKSHATILNHIGKLEKSRLIAVNKSTLYPTYHANASNEYYLLYKKRQIVFRLLESGIVDYIWNKTLASAIILYGSCAKGAYSKGSDIDLFVEAKEQALDLGAYEKKLGMPIHLVFEPNIRDLPNKGLLNNLVNGAVLYGFLKIA